MSTVNAIIFPVILFVTAQWSRVDYLVNDLTINNPTKQSY